MADADGKTSPAKRRRPAASSPAGEVWRAPVSLERIEVPPWPSQVLPGFVDEWVSEVARFTQTPPDLAGTVALSALSAAVRGRYDVEAPRGHREALVLWTLAVASPAERKSAVFAAMAEPLEEWERVEATRLGPEIEQSRVNREILDARFAGAKRHAASASAGDARDDAEAEVRHVAEQLALCPVVTAPRMLADDCTNEALTGLLAREGGRLAILSPEGGAFDLIGGMYSDGRANIDAILKAHDGESIRVDRRGREHPEHVERACLTIGLTVQPQVLKDAANRRQFRGRGLLARFLYAVPLSMVGRRETNVPPSDDDTRQRYVAGVRAVLDGLPNEARTLECDDDALSIWLDFAARVEPRLGPDGDLHEISDLAGKMAGTVARMAGLFHVVAGADGPIDSDAMINAVRLGDYYLSHASAAFTMMGFTPPRVALARRIMEWVRLKSLRAFSAREAFDALRSSQAPKMTDFKPALALLAERGWIRPSPPVPTNPSGGRPPSQQYDVNPRA